MGRPVLQVVIASTRPGRIGEPFARWFVPIAEKHGAFDVEVVDLAAVNLPFMDEPKHPRLGQYQHEHTKRWSATVSRGDAFVFVTPEYNYGYNAVLKNAIDYLHHEWANKAVGFLSYGGVAAGTRSVQQLRQVLSALRVVTSVEAVNVPFAAQFLDEDREVQANDVMMVAAGAMLDELARLTALLRPQENSPRAPRELST
ncbi:MAG: NADPH-dependent FMN reductase [Kineosporiaceae bacterium]